MQELVVHHRVDGLENISYKVTLNEGVHHRVDGLEKTV